MNDYVSIYNELIDKSIRYIALRQFKDVILNSKTKTQFEDNGFDLLLTERHMNIDKLKNLKIRLDKELDESDFNIYSTLQSLHIGSLFQMYEAVEYYYDNLKTLKDKKKDIDEKIKSSFDEAKKAYDSLPKELLTIKKGDEKYLELIYPYVVSNNSNELLNDFEFYKDCKLKAISRPKDEKYHSEEKREITFEEFLQEGEFFGNSLARSKASFALLRNLDNYLTSINEPNDAEQ